MPVSLVTHVRRTSTSVPQIRVRMVEHVMTRPMRITVHAWMDSMEPIVRTISTTVPLSRARTVPVLIELAVMFAPVTQVSAVKTAQSTQMNALQVHAMRQVRPTVLIWSTHTDANVKPASLVSSVTSRSMNVLPIHARTEEPALTDKASTIARVHQASTEQTVSLDRTSAW